MSSVNWQVLKFGGTSVSTVKAWENITTILKRKLAKNHRLLVVHSALSQVSNQLERILESARDSAPDIYKLQLEKLKSQHLDLINDLGLKEEIIAKHMTSLERLLKGVHLIGDISDKTRALVLAQGEIWSTVIGYSYLSQHLDTSIKWLDAREYIKASSTSSTIRADYLNIACDYRTDKQLGNDISEYQCVITQGFIGSNDVNETILLGRGGSDTSASIFAAKVQSMRLEIWTDVPGVFTANPKQVENARLLKDLSYEESQEMASSGAKVLHPRAIKPAQSKNIPIYIRSTLDPKIRGTKISQAQTGFGLVKAITAKSGVTLVSMESQGMWHQAGYLADLFAIYKEHDVSIDLISTSETNVTVSLDNLTQVIDDGKLALLKSDLENICQVKIIENCSAVSIVGKNVRAILHKIAPALQIFENFPVYLMSQSASDLNLTFVIDSEYRDKTIISLHEILISSNPNGSLLGPTIKELNSSKSMKIDNKWWLKKSNEILDFIGNKENAYLYNLETVRNNIQELRSITAIDRIFYAMKANNHEQILTLVEQEGVGFETVSIAEIEKVHNQFKMLDPKRIFFTPNFAPKIEYEQALKKGVTLSLDSGYPIKYWPEIFANQSIFLRIDPAVGKGHHENVRTAGSNSKFGIPIGELESLRPILEEYKIRVIGLHAHSGSGILIHQHWAEQAILLAELGKTFSDVKYLNLGGGFGIKEREQQSSLIMTKIHDSLLSIKERYPEFELWAEPGRFLVANSGALVAKVTQVKQKQNYYYVGLNTGMNSLMRPALYGSYHEIHNLTRLNDSKNKLATIVGPICESTDKLAIEIPFPETTEGDVILIENTGAYGYVMSNHYNLRAPAKEYCISDE